MKKFMNKRRFINILLAALVVALAVTITYGVQFYRAVREIYQIEAANSP